MTLAAGRSDILLVGSRISPRLGIVQFTLVLMAMAVAAAPGAALVREAVTYGIATEAPLVHLLLRGLPNCRPLLLTPHSLRLRRPLSTPYDYPGETQEKEPLKAIEELNLSTLSVEESEDDEEDYPPLSQQVLLWRAIKLPIYSVALVPLSVGAAAAFWQTRIFLIGRFGLFLGSAVLVIAWLNLSNDAYDAETGVDKGKRESVVNMTGSREGVLISAYTCLLFGILGFIWGAWQAQNMPVVALLAGAITCGYIYQCPPFRLSYLGLGEPLCFIAFGPLATTAFYLSQASGRGLHSLPVTGTILGAATLVGITTSLILFCSHFHQIEGDRLVGKLSPLVRLGTEKGKEVVKAAILGLYSLVLVLAATKVIPYPCAFFSLLTVPIGKLVVDFVTENHDNREKIFLAKYFCVRLHAAFGVALVLGFLAASRMTLMAPS